MQHPLPDLGEWPPLEWEQWKDTAETLHMYMQIVGKARLGLTPIQNHWWNIAFYLTARGLTTSAMPADRGLSLDIEFDLLSHEVVCRTSGGGGRCRSGNLGNCLRIGHGAWHCTARLRRHRTRDGIARSRSQSG